MHRWMFLLALAGCAGTDDAATDAATDASTDDLDPPGTAGTSDGEEIPDAATCGMEYAFCGDLLLPWDFEGETRELAVALYTSIPPAGPPNATLAQIPAPSMKTGETYPLRLQPVLETGEYYLWVNLYMEGGGTWVPVDGVDYVGASAGKITLGGSEPIVFEDIVMEVASGW